MGFKNALKKLDEAVKDLTSLHVQTFTGQANAKIDGSQSFEDIRTIVAEGVKNGEIKLAAETLAQFDGDSYNFIKEDIDSLSPVILETHKNAVKAGIETRLGLLTLFKDFFD